jgi:pimeloyl-ACP methyl ester carboxylesterase
MTRETEMRILTPDGKLIDGILRGNPKKKPLVVFIHGFGGQMNDVMQYMAARIFEKNGFSSFRFNFFGTSSRARKSSECSLVSNGRDINTVLSYLRTELGAKKIFVAAHSFGVPSLLKANLAGISAIASWDGSLVPECLIKSLTALPEPKGYLFNFVYTLFTGEEMINESKRTQYEELFKDHVIPTLFAVSKKGRGFFAEEAEKMFPLAKDPKEIVFFNNARHGYTEEGAIEDLCKKTIEWFKKY